MSRRLLAWLLALLALPLAAPPAGAQDGEELAFRVSDIRREGDNLTVTLTNDRAMSDVRVSLLQGGALAALPERAYASWPAGQTREVTFALVRDIDSATIRLRCIQGYNWEATQQIGIVVPAADAGAPDDGDAAPRLVVADAALEEGNLTVTVSNAGDGAAGRILVSLEDGQGRKLGQPFYRSIDALAAGDSAAVRFAVAEGLSDVVVVVEHDAAEARTRVAPRTTAAAAGPVGDTNVTMTTELPFREVDVGRSLDFVVTVKNHGRLALVQLGAEGLPSGYSARFFVGGSAVPSLYLDRNQSRQVTMSVTVPNAATEVDRTVDFAVVASVNGTELARLPMGLAVRGVGRLDVSVQTSEAALSPGETARMSVRVTNEGSAPLFDVELDTRRPYGWTVRTEPPRLDRLDPGQAATISLELRAPDVVGAGRYGTDVSAKSGEVSSRWETVAVSVESTEGEGGGFLWLLFGGLILGSVGFAWWRKKQG